MGILKVDVEYLRNREKAEAISTKRYVCAIGRHFQLNDCLTCSSRGELIVEERVVFLTLFELRGGQNRRGDGAPGRLASQWGEYGVDNVAGSLAPFSLGQEAADCRVLLWHLGIERAHVVGHSSGGPSPCSWKREKGSAIYYCASWYGSDALVKGGPPMDFCSAGAAPGNSIGPRL